MKRYRKKIINKDRNRLSIFKSNRYLYVQLIDDKKRITVFSCSTKSVCNNEKLTKNNVDSFGKFIAEKIIELGVNKIVFDKGNTTYIFNISLLADVIRSYGIIF